jgi:hypothetical protein
MSSLLNRSPETVLAAFRRARVLFPFPIRGLDTDNGGEFINEEVVAYCAREQITFTRGRPACHNDTCFAEQKNRAIVRQTVGYDRLMGEQVYQQLSEVYRALRLHINCFQPSMKLQSKRHEEGKMRRVYDAAKTPLQRLLLSGVLPEQRQQELRERALAIDPLRLVRHLEDLQRALWRCAGNTPGASLVCFLLDMRSSASMSVEQATKPMLLPEETPKHADVQDWSHSMSDPFLGEWEQIHAFVCDHPTCSSGDILQEWQRRFPGRFLRSHLGTLQRGLREIRASLLETQTEPWPIEVIQGCPPDLLPLQTKTPEEHPQADFLPATSLNPTLAPSMAREAGWPSAKQPSPKEETTPDLLPPVRFNNPQSGSDEVRDQEQMAVLLPLDLSEVNSFPTMGLTIDQTIKAFLQNQHAHEWEPKTLEWHQTSLKQLQSYLAWRGVMLLSSLTGSEIRGWLTFLRTELVKTGGFRVNNTISTYARSAHAFCNWLVVQGYVDQSPFAQVKMPKRTRRRLRLIEQETFERLLHACRAGGTKRATMDHATARNQALLWVLWDTGLLVSEVCALNLEEVDLAQGALHIQGVGSKGRSLPLTPQVQACVDRVPGAVSLACGKARCA